MIPKFRAWILDADAMVEVQVLNFKDRRIIHDVALFGPLPLRLFQKQSYSVNFDDCILMQSTGLFDKNGVEVFEGDVVHESGAYILWDNHLSCWCYAHENDKESGIPPIPIYTNPRHLLLEVIGNIHENPELLENKKEQDDCQTEQ